MAAWLSRCKILLLKTMDDKLLEVDPDLAMRIPYLDSYIENHQGIGEIFRIPIQTAKADVVEMVLDWVTIRECDPRQLPNPRMDQFKQTFLQLDEPFIRRLSFASSLLGVDSLLNFILAQTDIFVPRNELAKANSSHTPAGPTGADGA